MNTQKLIDVMSKKGVTVKVRDREKWMNESLEVRAKHLAKLQDRIYLSKLNSNNGSTEDTASRGYGEGRRMGD